MMNEREKNLKDAIRAFSEALQAGLSAREYQPQRKRLFDAIQAADADFVLGFDTELLADLIRDARQLVANR